MSKLLKIAIQPRKLKKLNLLKSRIKIKKVKYSVTIKIINTYICNSSYVTKVNHESSKHLMPILHAVLKTFSFSFFIYLKIIMLVMNDFK